MLIAMRLSDVVPLPVMVGWARTDALPAATREVLDRYDSAVEQRMAALWPMKRVLSWAATVPALDMIAPGVLLRSEAAVGLFRRAGRVWPCLAAPATAMARGEFLEAWRVGGWRL